MANLENKNYLDLCQKYQGKILDCCSSSNFDEIINQSIYKNIFKKDTFVNLISKYPEISYQQIKIALKKIFGAKEYFFGCGSEDLIVRLNNFIKLNNKKVAVVEPIFYRSCENIKISKKIDYENFFDADLRGIDFCWIDNPNTINNSHLDKLKLLTIINKYPKIIFIIDETSILFLNNWRQQSFFFEAEKHQNIIVISSFSKYFALPGIRFGFGSTNKKLLKEINDISPFFPINNIASFCVLQILNNFIKYDQIRKRLEINKKIIYKLFQSNPDFEIMNSQTNFIWCKNKKYDTYKLFFKNSLLTYKNIDSTEMSDWVRLTIHSSKKINQELISKLLTMFKK